MKTNKCLSAKAKKYLLLITTPLLIATQVLAETQKPSTNSTETAATEEPVELKLSPIVITATSTEHTLRNAPASVSVVDRKELEARPINNVVDAIRDQEGISLVGRGLGGRKTFSVRGMESWHTLMLVDGKRINSSDDVVGHSNFQSGWVPPAAIERIEVVRGPLSSLYGSEALGGVVNVITRTPTDRWHGSMSLLGGNQIGDGGKEQKGAFWFGGPLTDWAALSVNGTNQRVGSSPLKKDHTLSSLEGSEQNNYGATLSLIPNDNHIVDLSFQKNRERRWRTALSAAKNYRSQYDLFRDHYSASYRGNFDNDWSVSAKAYRSILDLSNLNSNNVKPNAPQKLTENITEIQATTPLFFSNRLTFGAEWRNEELKHNALDKGKDDMTHKAVFVQDEWEMTDTLTATLGARLDHHEIFGTEISPRAYLVWQPDDHWTLKGGVGSGFRAPTIKQISENYSFSTGAHTFQGNSSLKPEKSKSWELSAAYDQDLYGVSVTVFNNDVDNLISTECVANCNLTRGKVYKYVNINQAEIFGLETGINLYPADQFKIRLNHTWLDTENKRTGKKLPERPRHTANLKISWLPTFMPKESEIFFRTEYTGKQVTYSTTTTNKLPSYTLFHLGTTFPVYKNFYIKAGVENIANKRLEKVSDNFGYEERGRFLYTGIEWRF